MNYLLKASRTQLLFKRLFREGQQWWQLVELYNNDFTSIIDIYFDETLSTPSL
jgi:hypothetical protein